MSDTDQCARCGGDCGMSQCEDEQQAAELDQQAAGLALEDDWEPCDNLRPGETGGTDDD
jgi:hypothetical protein